MKQYLKPIVVAASILIIVGFVGLYYWQHSQVKSLTGQLSTIESNNSSVKKSNDNLAKQLSEANSTIASLTQRQDFKPGTSCQSQQLALSQEGGAQGAAGSTGVVFSYQNVSKSSCNIDGYPGFLAIDSSGHVMPNGPVQVPKAAPSTITLTPLAKAYFLGYWPHFEGGGDTKGCISPSLIESTPPGNYLPLTIKVTDIGYICPTPNIGALSLDKSALQ